MTGDPFGWLIHLLSSKSFWRCALYIAAILVAMHHLETFREDVAAIRKHLKSIDDQLSKRL